MAVEDDRLMTTADVIVSELLSFSIFIQQIWHKIVVYRGFTIYL